MMRAILFGLSAGMMIIGVIFVLLYAVAQIIAYWRIFTKAGEPGWKSLIPVYNTYIQYKISWTKPWMYWISIALAVIGIIFMGVGNLVAGIPADNGVARFLVTMVLLGSRLLWFVCYIASMAINVLANYKLSRAFGHGIGFTLGLLFLSPVFILILGFGNSYYFGPQD